MIAPRIKRMILGMLALSIFSSTTLFISGHVLAQEASTPPEPFVAIHVSELTQALETMPAKPPTPPAGPDTTGYEWAYTSWHYFVAYESLKEALRSDGTPFVQVSDADITSGKLLQPDGSPRYPILISLASEAISDAEISPLRNYVDGGGTLLIGSSSFTRRPDGTMRGDFALADEMGVHVVDANLDNWGENMKFTKVLDHPLISNIPSGTLTWRMPLTSEEIPIEGVDPNVVIHGNHFIWRVTVADATVIAKGSSTPLLTIRNYGKGTFIYHSVFQPLIGHGGYDSDMYAYLIYRNAIERAFQSAKEPIVRLSPWRYQYDAAFVIRHDFENYPDMIRSIETSAAFEFSQGAHGDYFFCTGTLRDQMADKTTVISSLRRAVSNYGATIGSHNGGLKNPLYPSLNPSAYDYWHWGPDDVLDVTPSGYANGKAYAESSLAKSFGDIEGWLTGVDNGRSGCGAAGTCPRIWVSPKFNSTRENSYDLLAGLNAVTVGEQKVGPFPHWTVSTQTAGKRYDHVTLPVSNWYVGTDVLQTLDDHNSSTMRDAVDFYYSLGALINLYGHNKSESGTLQGEYITYSVAKPRVWATNSIGVYDWWRLRSKVSVTPGYTKVGETGIARAAITGATDSGTALEVVIPGLGGVGITGLQVFLDGTLTSSDNYRITKDGVKVKVGTSVSDVEVRYEATPASASSIWSNTTIPANITDPETGTIEVGVKFRSDISGYITGLRFYKSSSNTGTHVGSLWTSTGTLLGRATFTNETASGWQQVNLSTPVAISADSVYVVSYHTNVGHYSCDENYFAGKGVDNPPLHALADGVSGENGVGAYGSTSTFPNQGWRSSNYWVDVVFSATVMGDITLPTVTAFTIPATATALTVSITSFTATDNVGVTGYMVKESSTTPSATATGWSATAPTSYTFTTPGTKTLYAWAKDAAGNVSVSRSASVGITLDTTSPTVTAFTIPATATMLTVPITSFTVTDNVGVTGYMVNESASAPSATAGGWLATAPTSYTFTTAGSKALYAWAKDAAGNVSASRSASVTITLDTTPPTVTSFTIPATATTLTVSINSFTATDNVVVTGYMVTESATTPSATAGGWLPTAPTSYTFTTPGSKTLYAWAKDAASNVSANRSASVTITLPDTTRPTVTAFTIPAMATTLTVPITSFTATDNVGVTGYMVKESSTTPSATATGWSATAPTSYTFTTPGTKTLYAWAKDAAGNVSARRSSYVTIRLSDTTRPTVTAFTIPATATTLTVPITGFTATDNVGVMGYMVKESSTTPSATASGWSATAPTSYTFTTAGSKTLYAWAKDAAGNVSTRRSASVTITLP